jgi:hypothetical protein
MADLFAPAQDAPAAPVSAEASRALAQNMLLGQHGVGFTADYTGLSQSRVKAMAETLHKARRIPKVRP